jgi:hypothetical protein
VRYGALEAPLDFNVRFSNRPAGVKRFSDYPRLSVDVARGLALLFGLGTSSLRKNGKIEPLFCSVKVVDSATYSIVGGALMLDWRVLS